MPRKNNGIPFFLQLSPQKGPDGKPLLYARPMPGMKLDKNYADNIITQVSHFHHGELSSVLETFIDAFSRYIANGYRIETPLGTFGPKLKMNGQYTDPESVNSAAVNFAGIEFKPSKRFLDTVKKHQHGCHPARYATSPSIPVSDNDLLIHALEESMTNGYTTMKSFMQKSTLKYKKAKLFLDSLCEGEHPLLSRKKEGNTMLYTFTPKE